MGESYCATCTASDPWDYTVTCQTCALGISDDACQTAGKIITTSTAIINLNHIYLHLS